MTSPLARIRFLLDHRWSPRHMSEHLDGDLSPTDDDRLRNHVKHCPQCHELLRGLRATLAGLARIGRDDDDDPPRSVAASIAAHVRSESPRREDDDESTH